MEMNQFLSLVAISGVVCLVCLWAAQLYSPGFYLVCALGDFLVLFAPVLR